MNAIDQPITEASQRGLAFESNSPEALTNIYRDECNMAVWQRQISPSLQASLHAFLQTAHTLQISRSVTPQSVQTELHESLHQMDCALELSQDVAELVDMFCCLFDLKQVGLRLTSLDRAMCPRFHVDQVPCRLITTYLGEATQWLPHHLVERSKLGSRSQGVPDEKSGLFQAANDIQQVSSGDVALLKGERWEGNENAGLVHRSPALITGQKRLLLTLDFIN